MRRRINWDFVLKAFLNSVFAALLATFILGGYYLGYFRGYSKGSADVVEQIASSVEETIQNTNSNTPFPVPNRVPAVSQTPSWTGPQLWESVNKRRSELGVNPLSTKSELCTIASIRLNELLALGTLDGHEGFSNMPDRREDLKWIFETYNLTEFLVAGADSPTEAVSLWENTLGHNKLLTGGEYVWGCIYAQEGFAVAITAF